MKLSEWAKASGACRQSVEQPPAGRAGAALYARVSSGDQRADLECQLARLAEQAPSTGAVVSKVLTSFCARLYGRRTARHRASTAVEAAGKAA